MLFFPTADEDFKYFRSQGYDGSINDMHYKAMGDLGYTGSLNDRIHAFLTANYGSFYEAMRDLRNGTSVFALYAVNTLIPPLVLDFKLNTYKKENVLTTLSSAVTHARASSATMTNSSGVLVTVGNNVPRTGHHIYNGSTWVNEGILHESEARTNLLLNSGTLSTQNVTVSATPYTLSFTGTGTVTLTGVSTAGPLVGTGTGENNRVNLTFTPTAGTLTLTVSGTVTNAQAELGSTPSSYIPTSGSTATRAAETLTVPAANLPYSSTNMSIQMDGKMTYADNAKSFTLLDSEILPISWYADSNNTISMAIATNGANTGIPIFYQKASSVADEVLGSSTYYSPNINVPFNFASRHGSTFINAALAGTALTANTTPTALPDLSSTDLNLGSTFMGTIAQFRMWDEDLTDSGIAEAST